MQIIKEIKTDEGFSGYAYNDSLGFPTIGYGTKLPLSEDEAMLLLNKRLNDTYAELTYKLDFEIENDELKDILLNMSYQMGVPGLLRFKKMLKAVKEKNYQKASAEMLNSLWVRQTPNRAKRLAKRMQDLA